MIEVNPGFSALTGENKSYLRFRTTVVSMMSCSRPLSMYSKGVPSPMEQDPITGCGYERCFLLGDVVDITDLEAPESRYIHNCGGSPSRGA